MKKIYCELCNENISVNKINKHLKEKHNMTQKEYYDKFLLKENENICFYCGGLTEFSGKIINGYNKLCSKCRKNKVYNTKEYLIKFYGSEEKLKEIFGTYTKDYYIKKYGEEEGLKKWEERKQKISENIKKSYKENLSKNKNYTKEKSLFCEEYWIKRGFSEEEVKIKAENYKNKILKKRLEGIQRAKENGNYLKSNIRRPEYWIKKGFSEEEARKKISELQKTFSLEICIKKYGEEKGYKRWSERQEKWKRTLNNKSEKEKREINRKKIEFNGGCSNAANNVFEIIEKEIPELDGMFFKKSNREFVRFNEKIKKYMKFDYVDLKKKLVIEFNGDFWHCNPKLYKKEFYHKLRKQYAYEIWEEDEEKINFIKNLGYNVIIIWESEWKENKNKVLEKIRRYLSNVEKNN